ncbi:hypothetical protein [Amycolatopsis sp. NPDC059657]|uniref:hypothetical protein n=1 Tax=Amycolatopsis sp. NPDC059657 TaxID=3346899 RepID=UPI0036711359
MAAVAVLALSGAVVAVPAASAQSGSRICGRLVAGQASQYTLYLVEVDKDSKGWGEFDKDFQACENTQERWADSSRCSSADCYEYVKCETISSVVNWSRYTGRPSGYNPKDICTSMKRRAGYKLGLSGSPNALTTNSFTTS